MSTTTDLPFSGSPSAATTSPLAAVSPETALSHDSPAWKALCSKRIMRCAITIKHTDVSKDELQRSLLDLAPFSYIKIARELHKKPLVVDGVKSPNDYHLHAIVAGARFQFGTLYRKLFDVFGSRVNCAMGPSYAIDIRLLDSQLDVIKWDQYIAKDGDFIVHGEFPAPGPKKSFDSASDEVYSSFLEIASTQGLSAAMEFARVNMVSEFCTKFSSLRDAATHVLPVRPRYIAPSMKADLVTARPWQEYWLPRVMDANPVPRRIHWIYSSPGSGKDWIQQYLEANHPMGCYSPGQSCCLDNLLYGYEEEGCVVFNFTKNFDWSTFSGPASHVIEKFSDFGSKSRALKYKGKKVQFLSHVIVLANRPPIPELVHRDVVVFDVDAFNSQLAFKNKLSDLGVSTTTKSNVVLKVSPTSTRSVARTTHQGSPPRRPRRAPAGPDPLPLPVDRPWLCIDHGNVADLADLADLADTSYYDQVDLACPIQSLQLECI